VNQSFVDALFDAVGLLGTGDWDFPGDAQPQPQPQPQPGGGGGGAPVPFPGAGGSQYGDFDLVVSFGCNGIEHLGQYWFEDRILRGVIELVELGTTDRQAAKFLVDVVMEADAPSCGLVGYDNVGPNLQAYWSSWRSQAMSLFDLYRQMPGQMEQDKAMLDDIGRPYVAGYAGYAGFASVVPKSFDPKLSPDLYVSRGCRIIIEGELWRSKRLDPQIAAAARAGHTDEEAARRIVYNQLERFSDCTRLRRAWPPQLNNWFAHTVRDVHMALKVYARNPHLIGARS